MDERTFVSPNFIPQHADREYMQEHRASQKASMVWSLINVARLAHENETSGEPHDHRGIGQALEIAGWIAEDLIDGCETLEKRLQRAERGPAGPPRPDG